MLHHSNWKEIRTGTYAQLLALLKLGVHMKWEPNAKAMTGLSLGWAWWPCVLMPPPSEGPRIHFLSLELPLPCVLVAFLVNTTKRRPGQSDTRKDSLKGQCVMVGVITGTWLEHAIYEHDGLQAVWRDVNKPLTTRVNWPIPAVPVLPP